MANRSKQRFYGNRNKIVRVRNEQAEWMIQLISNRLGINYQAAFELLMDDLEARSAYTWAHVSEVIDKARAAK